MNLQYAEALPGYPDINKYSCDLLQSVSVSMSLLKLAIVLPICADCHLVNPPINITRVLPAKD